MRGGIAGVQCKGLTEAVDGLVAFIGRELPVAFRDLLLTVVLPEEFLGGERGNIAGVQPQGIVQQSTPFLDVASADGLYRGYIILMSPFLDLRFGLSCTRVHAGRCEQAKTRDREESQHPKDSIRICMGTDREKNLAS